MDEFLPREARFLGRLLCLMTFSIDTNRGTQQRGTRGDAQSIDTARVPLANEPQLQGGEGPAVGDVEVTLTITIVIHRHEKYHNSTRNPLSVTM